MNNKKLLLATLLLLFAGVWSFTHKLENHPHHDDHQHEQDHAHDEENEQDKHTSIPEEEAKYAGIKTAIAQSGNIAKKLPLEGRVILNPNKTYNIGARFSGVVKTLKVNLGDQVKKGQLLAVIESNESLNNLKIIAPSSGTITAVDVHIGEIINQQRILQISDLSRLWAEFHLFPSDIKQVKKGQTLELFSLNNTELKAESKVERISAIANISSQTALMLTSFDNKKLMVKPGMHINSAVTISQKKANLVVTETALQNLDGQTVVFVKEDDNYEAQPIKLGLSDGTYVEVLSGLTEGAEYVSEKAFLIKADIEKSGASHDH